MPIYPGRYPAQDGAMPGVNLQSSASDDISEEHALPPIAAERSEKPCPGRTPSQSPGKATGTKKLHHWLAMKEIYVYVPMFMMILLSQHRFL